MDEQLARKLSRQLKILNIMVSFFGVITLTGLVVLGFLLWQVFTFAQNINNQVADFRTGASEQLNVRDQACQDESLGSFLKNNTDVCQ